MGDFFSAVGDILSAETTYRNAAVLVALLIFAAGGELIAEKAGTINISLDAMLLAGGFAAAVFFDLAGSVAVGLGAAVLAGLVVAGVQANMSHRLPADQFVVGLVLNVLIIGLTGYLRSEIEPQSRLLARTEIPILSDIPLVGEALFDQAWPFYLVYPVIPLVWWLAYRTRWGLEVRAIGEDPNAADVSGLPVNKRRRETIYLTGLLCGLGGGYFLYVSAGLFEETLIGGRGIIAIAAVIFGGWTLKGTIGGCILFGAVASFALSIPGLGYDAIDREFLAMAPHLATILGMAIFAKRVRQPQALARPFLRGLK